VPDRSDYATRSTSLVAPAVVIRANAGGSRAQRGCDRQPEIQASSTERWQVLRAPILPIRDRPIFSRVEEALEVGSVGLIKLFGPKHAQERGFRGETATRRGSA
jgi:hypothetical protein